MNRWSALALLLFFVAALALRLPRLDTRPLHNDEAVNAIKVAELWEQGRYAYDPDEYHGPTLHYATLPILRFSGAENAGRIKDSTLRLAPVLFGAGLILLLWLFVPALGGGAILWAALFTAISPAMVFYSRYFIHEMLLVFFTALTIGAGWRYSQTRSAGWAALAGAGLGLMWATKETFVLTLAAMTFALVLTAWRSSLRRTWHAFAAGCQWKHIIFAFAVALAVGVLFFSSFFTNAAGPLDSVLTYLPWLKRAGGHSPHIHPWHFYLERLAWFHPPKSPVWSEALILILALVGMLASLRKGASPLHQFLALYTIALTAIYSVISYKTPWCLLSFFHGMILLAGVGAATALAQIRPRWGKFAVTLLFLGLTGQLALQAYRANFQYAADRRNPYVYAQTVPDLLNLVERVEGLARVSTNGYETVVKVIARDGDYWPLPWYLRRFRHIGWYEAMPDDPYAPLVIVSSNFDAELDEKSERKWIMVGLTELRPEKFFELYVELELWKRYVETLPRDRD